MFPLHFQIWCAIERYVNVSKERKPRDLKKPIATGKRKNNLLFRFVENQRVFLIALPTVLKKICYQYLHCVNCLHVTCTASTERQKDIHII